MRVLVLSLVALCACVPDPEPVGPDAWADPELAEVWGSWLWYYDGGPCEQPEGAVGLRLALDEEPVWSLHEHDSATLTLHDGGASLVMSTRLGEVLEAELVDDGSRASASWTYLDRFGCALSGDVSEPELLRSR